MEVLVILADALEDLHALLDGGLRHGDGLEAPLEGRVLFDVLAVLVEGGCADDLDLAPGQGGLQDIRGVHAALGVARADDVMDLVDHEDNIALLFDLFDEVFHAAFKLAAELRSGNEGGQIDQQNLLVPELIRHLIGGDALGKAFRDGGLADAWLADEAGIVLLPAVEDLNDALKLLLAADHAVEPSVTRSLGQGNGIVFQKLLFPVSALFALGRGLAGIRTGGGGIVTAAAHLALRTAEQAIEERERGGFALVVIVAVTGFDAEQAFKTLGIAEGGGHFPAEGFDVLIGQPHAGNDIVHGLDVQLAGAG